jgi:hypothetical protein
MNTVLEELRDGHIPGIYTDNNPNAHSNSQEYQDEKQYAQIPEERPEFAFVRIAVHGLPFAESSRPVASPDSPAAISIFATPDWTSGDLA